MSSEALVRAAFADLAEASLRLGSPFTSLLVGLIGERLDRTTQIGRRVLDWPGEPDSAHDAVQLRLVGGLHGLVLDGRRPALARLYPPAEAPDPEMLWREVESALVDERAALDAWLDHAPQTNEVARAPILMCGLKVVTAATGGLPIALHELGASGGLNLLLDQYSYCLGGVEAGAPRAGLRFEPDWTGPPPPNVSVSLHSRQGVDLNPLDMRRAADRHRLLSYVWPDHYNRIARIAAAIEIARANPAPIERDDAAAWITRRMPPEGAPGIARVVMHSVAFQYFPRTTQRRVLDHISLLGERATRESPFAWLRFEVDNEAGGAALRLKLWPHGKDVKLATGNAQQPVINWIG